MRRYSGVLAPAFQPPRDLGEPARGQAGAEGDGMLIGQVFGVDYHA